MNEWPCVKNQSMYSKYIIYQILAVCPVREDVGEPKLSGLSFKPLTSIQYIMNPTTSYTMKVAWRDGHETILYTMKCDIWLRFRRTVRSNYGKVLQWTLHKNIRWRASHVLCWLIFKNLWFRAYKFYKFFLGHLRNFIFVYWFVIKP